MPGHVRDEAGHCALCILAARLAFPEHGYASFATRRAACMENTLGNLQDYFGQETGRYARRCTTYLRDQPLQRQLFSAQFGQLTAAVKITGIQRRIDGRAKLRLIVRQVDRVPNRRNNACTAPQDATLRWPCGNDLRPKPAVHPILHSGGFSRSPSIDRNSL